MHKEDEHVQCPYYREDGQQAVHCEGVEAGSRLQLGFSTAMQHRSYKQRHCRSQWRRCLIARMLSKKYDYQP